jgi:hypothetical protein
VVHALRTTRLEAEVAAADRRGSRMSERPKPTRPELALVALSLAMLVVTLLVALRNWSGTLR